MKEYAAGLDETEEFSLENMMQRVHRLALKHYSNSRFGFAAFLLRSKLATEILEYD